ncbi:MAG: CPBP family intramembrane glutamic endopeptidase [Verrucomicrobiota bacterium]
MLLLLFLLGSFLLAVSYLESVHFYRSGDQSENGDLLRLHGETYVRLYEGLSQPSSPPFLHLLTTYSGPQDLAEELDIAFSYAKGKHLSPEGVGDWALYREAYGHPHPIEHLSAAISLSPSPETRLYLKTVRSVLEGTPLSPDQEEWLRTQLIHHPDRWVVQRISLLHTQREPETKDYRIYQRAIHFGGILAGLLLLAFVSLPWAWKGKKSPYPPSPYLGVGIPGLLLLTLVLWALLICFYSLSWVSLPLQDLLGDLVSVPSLTAIDYALFSFFSIALLWPLLYGSSFHAGWKSLRLHQEALPRAFWLVVLGWFGIQTLVGIPGIVLPKLLGQIDTRDYLHPLLLSTDETAFSAMLVMSGGCAPIAEEILYRGFLFLGLSRWLGVRQSAIWSSFLFAVAHCSYSPLGVLWVFLFGIVQCWSVHRTGSLWPAIAVHAIHNLLWTSHSWYLYGNFST